MYDVAINNGLIVDGTGAPAYFGSIGIKKDRIEHISPDRLYGKHTINAEGLTVTPGFIDVHTHSDTSFIIDNRLENKVYQGVTTDIIGNCGISIFPSPGKNDYYELFKKYCSGLLVGTDKLKNKFEDINAYKDALKRTKTAINCGILAGHGTLRICAMGFENRKSTDEEIETMKELLDHQIENGAIGMSLGLIYPPGSFSDKHELIELAKVIKKHDALLTAHIRNEKAGIFEAVKEMIDIAQTTRVRLHISHLKLMGESNWGKTEKLLNMIADANEKGVIITCDQYPYSASSTTLAAVVPSWAHEGGTSKMLERLREKPEVLEHRIARLIDERDGAGRIKIAHTFGTKPQYEGLLLSELAQIMDLNAAQTVIKALDETNGKVNAIYFSMSDRDVEHILSQENIIVGSDGSAQSYDNKVSKGLPHPRNFGTFPRAVRMGREIGRLSREKIIRKMTGLPAEVFKLKGTGSICIGNYADITIFDWDEFEDTATFENPYQKPTGIKHVLVSGSLILEDGEMTQNRPGRIF